MPQGIEFSGPFADLSAASAASTGYDAKAITDGIQTAMERVRFGQAAMERDGFALQKAQYPYQLLTTLLHLAAKGNRRLRVLDFGGSLGSSYYACRPWLENAVDELSWTVVEQPHFVEIGKAKFATEELSFAPDVESLGKTPDLVLASGVLMYLDQPSKTLQQLLELRAPMVVIDRTATVPNDEDVLTVEHVRSPTYTASYPCRFLSLPRLIQACQTHYDCLEVFPAIDNFKVSFADLKFIGMILRLKSQ